MDISSIDFARLIEALKPYLVSPTHLKIDPLQHQFLVWQFPELKDADVSSIVLDLMGVTSFKIEYLPKRPAYEWT